jgi:IS5 family transposase
MGEQRTFAGIAWSQKGKVTRRERFLAEMDAVIPWAQLLALIAPYYPKAGQGRQPLGLKKMLRIYFLQQWFNLSDLQAEDAIYDSEAMRRFARVELGDDVVPDETTILRFRHLLEQHRLTAAIFEAVKELLTAKRLLLQSGTIVDATIIAAPSSTKNAAQARDPEMKQTRKGNTWHFGMKLHVGTDPKGRVHSLTATHAGVADITQLPQLLHGEERVLYGDQGLLEGSRSAGPGGPGRAVSGESPRRRPSPAADRALARHQSGAVADPRPRRAPVPRGQAAVGVRQGALPRHRQEPGARLQPLRAG